MSFNNKMLLLFAVVALVLSTFAVSSMVATRYMQEEALVRGYGYLDKTNEFHWYEWDPSDDKIS